MSSSLHVKESEVLTKLCESIFGPVVVKAWIAKETYGYSDSIYSVHSDVDEFNEINTDDPDETMIQLPTDGSIIVEFNTGRRVTFSTSEWGCIEKVTQDLIVRTDEEDFNC